MIREYGTRLVGSRNDSLNANFEIANYKFQDKEASMNRPPQRRFTKRLSSGLFVVALVAGGYSAGKKTRQVSADNSPNSNASSRRSDSEEAVGKQAIQSDLEDGNSSISATKITSSLEDAEEKEFYATAYSQSGKTASGTLTRRGMIAADPRILPLGTVVEIRAGRYSGTYQVLDTGGRIKGHLIDIYMPDRREALVFGRRAIKLKVVKRSRRAHGAHSDAPVAAEVSADH
jgi:3D (Asp-Asp-Asp) domain-containing protein